MNMKLFLFAATFFVMFINNELKAKDKQYSKRNAEINYPKKECLVVRNPEDLGFGAIFFSLLKILNDFDHGKFIGFEVNFDNPCYVDKNLGPNWWEYLFEPLHLGKTEGKKSELKKWDSLKTVRFGYRLTKERVSELFQKYIFLRPEIKSEIDDFVDHNFVNFYVIGVHHRGTDKKTEAPLVPYEKTFEVLQKKIETLSNEQRQQLKIFVATDDVDFLNLISDKYFEKVTYNDFVRSFGDKPLHYSQNLYSSNYQKCKEAVVDCILLSRCDFLIYPSASSFSLLSSKLNPNLDSIGIIPN